MLETGPLNKTIKSCALEEKSKYTKKKSVGPLRNGYRLFNMKNVLEFLCVFPCPSYGGSEYTHIEKIAGLKGLLYFTCAKPDCSSVYQMD